MSDETKEASKIGLSIHGMEDREVHAVMDRKCLSLALYTHFRLLASGINSFDPAVAVLANTWSQDGSVQDARWVYLCRVQGTIKQTKLYVVVCGTAVSNRL